MYFAMVILATMLAAAPGERAEDNLKCPSTALAEIAQARADKRAAVERLARLKAESSSSLLLVSLINSANDREKAALASCEARPPVEPFESMDVKSVENASEGREEALPPDDPYCLVVGCAADGQPDDWPLLSDFKPERW